MLDLLLRARTRILPASVILGLLVATVATVRPAAAQAAAEAGSRWEFLLSSGALVPTGGHRHAIKDAPLSTAQLSRVVGDRFAMTASAGWARSRDLASSGSPKLDVFTYDAGAELRRARRAAGAGITIVPFVGAGAGGRSYDHRGLDRDATHGISGYAAAGAELGMSRLRVRIELRDYVTGSRPPAGTGASAARNDIVTMVGLRFARRGS